MRWLLTVFALTAFSVGAQVPQFESWTDTTFTAWRNQRTELNVNIQERSYPSRLDAYRTRTGPIIEHRLREGLSFWGGAYFQHVQTGVGEKQSRDNLGRFFGGLTYRVYRKGILQIDGRTVAERLVGVTTGVSSRFRQRILVNFDQRLAPYASNEIFWNGTGLLSNRTAVGLRTRFNSEWALLTGFLWENRSFAYLPSRGALVISVAYRKRPPRKS